MPCLRHIQELSNILVNKGQMVLFYKVNLYIFTGLINIDNNIKTKLNFPSNICKSKNICENIFHPWTTINSKLKKTYLGWRTVNQFY